MSPDSSSDGVQSKGSRYLSKETPHGLGALAPQVNRPKTKRRVSKELC
jgi:hypothetical protein